MARERVATFGDEILAKFRDAVYGSPIRKHGPRVSRAASSDRVEALKREAKRVDAAMAACAIRVAAVSLDELALAQSRRRFLRQDGNAFRRHRQLFAQHDFRKPGAAQNGARSRCAGVLGKSRRESENSAASFVAKPFHALPVAFRIEPVMLCELLIHEGVTGIQQRKNAAIVLNEVDKEAGHFLLHIIANIGERGKVALAFLIEHRHIPNVQPLAPKLRGEPSHIFALQHPAHFSDQHLGIAKPFGGNAQRVIRRG